MKGLLLTAMLALGAAASLRAGVDVRVNIGAPPYYGYAPREVVYVERYVPAYDVQRVFVVSRYARVQPRVIVSLYRDGWGWDRICHRYSVPTYVVYGGGPRGYYSGPPYGVAKGHYKHKHFRRHGRGGWHE